MTNDSDKKRQEAKAIQEELNKQNLSRRGLLRRLKLLGVAFGAGYLMSGKSADALTGSGGEASEAVASLKSTNAALNEIIDEGRSPDVAGEENADERGSRIKTAYRRVYARAYRRVYGRI
jgi:hypothetical protein